MSAAHSRVTHAERPEFRGREFLLARFDHAPNLGEVFVVDRYEPLTNEMTDHDLRGVVAARRLASPASASHVDVASRHSNLGARPGWHVGVGVGIVGEIFARAISLELQESLVDVAQVTNSEV